MGVYVFQSKHTEWIKVGHHRVTARRPNVYYRIAHRGFHSCKHPHQLENCLDEEHWELQRWYPSLGCDDEREAHGVCEVSVGEFHPTSELARVLACLDARGTHAMVTSQERDAALLWSSRMVRRHVVGVAPVGVRRDHRVEPARLLEGPRPTPA